MDAGASELPEELAQDLRQRQVRPDRGCRFRREERRIDGVASCASGQHVEDLIGDLLGDCYLRLGRRGSEVWSQERVRCIEQWGAGGRLRLEDIDTRPTEMARAERVGDGSFIDNAAACDVQDEGPGP